MKLSILVLSALCCALVVSGCSSEKKATEKDKETIERIMKTGITNGPGPGAQPGQQAQPNQPAQPAPGKDANQPSGGLRVPKPGEGGPT